MNESHWPMCPINTIYVQGTDHRLPAESTLYLTDRLSLQFFISSHTRIMDDIKTLIYCMNDSWQKDKSVKCAIRIIELLHNKCFVYKWPSLLHLKGYHYTISFKVRVGKSNSISDSIIRFASDGEVCLSEMKNTLSIASHFMYARINKVIVHVSDEDKKHVVRFISLFNSISRITETF